MILFDREIKVKREGPNKPAFPEDLGLMEYDPMDSDLARDSSEPGDGYWSKLVKMIPAEIIAFFMALNAISASFPEPVKTIAIWLSFAIVVVGGVVYLYKYNNVRKAGQLIAMTIPLIIWIYVIGGPFTMFAWYHQGYGEFIGAIYTFFIPMVYNPEK